ncbi:uncharacterized protein LOC124127463 [Haliotis rufescens]|uniref:uncharacterized protein LOC124127463 n=1 Tax=Haliotis rufescens TaxID=6454 RepID=UPI00201EA0BE|nr:uncharacterized protein LOC124127463 [Haliotis rufescens]
MSRSAERTCFMIFLMFFVSADAFSTVCPSASTQTYSSMITATASNDTDIIFLASTSQGPVQMWMRAFGFFKEASLDPNTMQGIPLPTSVRMSPEEAESGNILVIVSSDAAALFIKTDHSMYQLRDISQLSKEYITVSYFAPNAAETWHSTIGISAVFNDAALDVTFKNGIDVEEIFSRFTNETKCNVTGQSISCKSSGSRRYVMQIQSRSDLSGTKITSSKDVSVIAGAVAESNVMDHMVPLDSLAISYTVFGFPGGNGSCVCRIVAASGLTDVTVDGVNTVTINGEGDYIDVNVSGDSFHTISATYPILVAMVIQNGESSSPAFIVAHSAGNVSQYTFTLISDDTNDNVEHYIVVPAVPQGGILLNGESPPNETLCMAVGGTMETGCFVPVEGYDAVHSISSSDGGYFTAYLIGSGDHGTFGSALIETVTSKNWTDPPPPLSLDMSYCVKSGGLGNYASNGTNVQMATMDVKKKRRIISFTIKHMRMPSAEACQLTCFLYASCRGVNYNSLTLDNNCDIVFGGPSCSDYNTEWTFYKMK